MSKDKHNTKNEIKPFVKWAGGKSSLIKHLIMHLPNDFAEQNDITYIEPFVGGGAMLFYMLTHYPNIRRVIINDVNKDLMFCYQMIKNNPQLLIKLLNDISNEFYALDNIDKKTNFYYQIRERYNNEDLTKEERTAYFIFLNKTCFNGLYRVNTKGKFNVPFGKYKKPKICDKDIIMSDHELLKKVDIHVGNYDKMIKHLGRGYNFLYMDPPYRPLSGTSSFIEYTRNVFDDTEQEKLKKFCDLLNSKGCKIMQSNSNSLDNDGESYFTKLYANYNITYIEAHRFINAYAGKREKETELLIMNYYNSSNNTNK